ncbi:MAG: ABC transporter ATP-binding protein [Trueperaceae bacterium]|nr:ABC transporter ATP-binding protein [Trueperaceae bacterium]
MIVDVNSLTYCYPKTQKAALNKLTFGIQEGEIFGFLGPSGAGKSTTQKILIGLLKEFEGEVKVFGRSLRDWKQDYYERVGISFELPNHYLKLTALENLRYFSQLYKGPTARPEDVLEQVGLSEDATKRVAEFSKGMKNRLNLARSLLHKPGLLFLDEPTSGLDPVNAKRVKDLIRQMQQAGTTIFLTTHAMSVAEDLCDRVAFLVEGEIKLIDSPRALRLEHGKRQIRVEYGSSDSRYEQDFSLDDLGSNEGFLELLKHERIQTIHTQETSLENIFIQVTGRQLA